jgi:hypothetical protein
VSDQPRPAPAAGEPAADTRAQPSEEELRAAYEAELSRISSVEMVLQAAVSLLNIGGYRMGAPASGEATGADARASDLEQVRDAVDAVRGLLPVLERRMPANELAPLRDALSRLQMAYAREAAAAERPPAPGEQQPAATADPGAQPGDAEASGPSTPGPPGQEQPAASSEEEQQGTHRPGPAESSGRLWVPGR